VRAELFAVTGDVPGNMSLSITFDAYLRMGEGESVWSSAVGCYVKIHTFPINHREVQVCDDEFFAIENGLYSVSHTAVLS
jgi:hypothetical protein